MNSIAIQAKELRKEYGFSLYSCIQFIKEYPDFEQMDKKDIENILGYKDWLKTFYDGDRSFEAYLRKIGG